MGKFLTSGSSKKQTNKKGMYYLTDNELYQDDDGSIYLAWRGYPTDDFTWIDAENWDTRCSHIHDVGCSCGQLVKVRLNEQGLRNLHYLHAKNDEIICEDIPSQFLQVVPITGHQVNNLFYRMLRDADCPQTPKYIQYAYRTGVCFNFGWFYGKKIPIDLNKLYNKEWNDQFLEI
jgi:hypothetical protein